MSNPDYSVQLVLAEIATFGAGVTPTLRLDLKAQKGLKSGQALVIQVLEAATQSGEATEIDRFSVRVVQRGATWVFQDVVDPRPAIHPARAGKYHLTDHIQLMFAGAEGAQVCILPVPDLGIPLPAFVSVKATAKDKPLESACAPRRVMRHFRAALLTQQLDLGARMAVGAVAGSVWNNAVSDAVVGKEARERMSLERQQKAKEEAQEQYQEFLKMQDTPLKVQGLRIQEYHKNLTRILEINRELEVKGDANIHTNTRLDERMELIERNKVIEAEAEQFLDISVGIPESYRVRASQGEERRKFVQQMADLENSFGFQLVCCLPLGGLAEGFVQILQGKYLEGLASIGLEVVTYGSFKTLGVLRRNFDAFQAANQTMRRAVFEARYLQVLSERTEIRLSMFKGVGKVVETQLGFLGPLFSMGAEGKELLDQIRDIGMLLKRKKEIGRALDVATNPGYRAWLSDFAKTNTKLVWFGAIRSLAFSYKVGDAAYEEAQELGKGVESQMKLLKPKDIQKKVVQGFKSVQSLLPEQEREWWNTVLVPGLERMSEEFFDPANEFIANWQQDKQEWEAEIRRLKREEGKGGQGPRLFQTKEELLSDLSVLMGFWKQRQAQFQRLFNGKGFKEVTEWHYANYQPPGVFFDTRLDEGMKSFLAQIGDAQCLMEADNTWNSRRLRDLVIFVSAGNKDPEKVIYVKDVFEERAKEFINLLHGAT